MRPIKTMMKDFVELFGLAVFICCTISTSVDLLQKSYNKLSEDVLRPF